MHYRIKSSVKHSCFQLTDFNWQAVRTKSPLHVLRINALVTKITDFSMLAEAARMENTSPRVSLFSSARHMGEY